MFTKSVFLLFFTFVFCGFGGGGLHSSAPHTPWLYPCIHVIIQVCSRILLGSVLQRLSAVVMLELTKVHMAVNELTIEQGNVSVCSLPEQS